MAETNDRVTAEIQESLNQDERTEDSNIDVINEGGVVTLVGTAQSAEARAAAEQIAERTAGVTNVINEIDVPSIEDEDRKEPDEGIAKGYQPQG